MWQTCFACAGAMSHVISQAWIVSNAPLFMLTLLPLLMFLVPFCAVLDSNYTNNTAKIKFVYVYICHRLVNIFLYIRSSYKTALGFCSRVCFEYMAKNFNKKAFASQGKYPLSPQTYTWNWYKEPQFVDHTKFGLTWKMNS